MCSLSKPAFAPCHPECTSDDCIRDLINEILEACAPYFITGAARSRPSLRRSSSSEPFSSLQFDSLLAFARTRPRRGELCRFIFDRLSPCIVVMLRALHRRRLYLPAEQRTSLVMAILVGFLAFFTLDGILGEFTRVTAGSNKGLARQVYHQPPADHPLALGQGSTSTILGFHFDFSECSLFENPFA